MPLTDCGFLTVIFYFYISTRAEFEQFVKEFKLKTISSKTWANTRKKKRLDLQNPVQYVNGSKGGEKNLYLNYFHIDRFKLLDNKLEHTLHECKACRAETHQATYKLKRSNSVSATPLEEIADTLRKTPSTATECKLFATSVADAANKVLQNAETPKTLQHYLKRKTSSVTDVTKATKREIIKDERDEAQQRLQRKDFVALYASCQSEAEYATHRKRAFGESRHNLKKKHTASLKSYRYERPTLISKLASINDINQINFTELAKTVKLTRNGIVPKNAGQVGINLYNSIDTVLLNFHYKLQQKISKRHENCII